MSDFNTPPPMPPEAPFNPYAPPTAEVSYARMSGAGGCYRQGKLLIVPRGFEGSLPAGTCVKCGRPASTVKKRQMFWHHPALYLIILAGLLLYVIVALIVRKKMVLNAGLCEQHVAKRRNMILAAWGAFLAGVAVPFISGFLKLKWSYAPLACLLLILLSLVLACIASGMILRPKRIDDREGRFTGCDESFLSQFPRG
jgi:hypothetical protein